METESKEFETKIGKGMALLIRSLLKPIPEEMIYELSCGDAIAVAKAGTQIEFLMVSVFNRITDKAKTFSQWQFILSESPDEYTPNKEIAFAQLRQAAISTEQLDVLAEFSVKTGREYHCVIQQMTVKAVTLHDWILVLRRTSRKGKYWKLASERIKLLCLFAEDCKLVLQNVSVRSRLGRFAIKKLQSLEN